MQTFTNKAGKEYQITINALTAERAAEELNVDLFSLESIGVACTKLSSQVRLLYLLTQTPETYEEFASGLDGDSLQRASKALQSELISFLPSDQAGLINQAIEELEGHRETVFSMLKEKASLLTA